MKLAIYITIFSSTNIIIGFLYQWYILVNVGPSEDSDALFASMTVPQIALIIVSGALTHVLVPLLSGEKKENLSQNAWGFFVVIGCLFTLITTMLYLASSWWVPLLVPGFSEPAKNLTVSLTRIQLIGMIFAAVNSVQLAVYHARQQFIWAEAVPVLLGVIGFLLLSWTLPLYGVRAAAWINVLRGALQTLLFLPGMGKPVKPNFTSDSMKIAWARAKPLLLGSAYYKTDLVVDRVLLSEAASGSITLYYFAQQIYGAIIQIINKAIVAPMVPLLSTLNKISDKQGFLKVYHARSFQAGLIVLTGLLFFVFIGHPALNIVIGYGNMTRENIDDLWWIMLYMSGVFVGGIMGQLCASCFYSVGDTVTPTRMSMLTYTFFIPCKVASFILLGVKGLALMTSIYYIVNWILQAWLQKKKGII